MLDKRVSGSLSTMLDTSVSSFAPLRYRSRMATLQKEKTNWYLNKNLLKVYRIYIFLSSLLFVDMHSLIGWILGFPECSFAALDISYVKIIKFISCQITQGVVSQTPSQRLMIKLLFDQY